MRVRRLATSTSRRAATCSRMRTSMTSSRPSSRLRKPPQRRRPPAEAPGGKAQGQQRKERRCGHCRAAVCSPQRDARLKRARIRKKTDATTPRRRSSSSTLPRSRKRQRQVQQEYLQRDSRYRHHDRHPAGGGEGVTPHCRPDPEDRPTEGRERLATHRRDRGRGLAQLVLGHVRGPEFHAPGRRRLEERPGGLHQLSHGSLRPQRLPLGRASAADSSMRASSRPTPSRPKSRTAKSCR